MRRTHTTVDVGPQLIGYLGLGVVAILLMIAFFWRQWRESVVVRGGLRSTLVVATPGGKVGIVSFDPSENRVTELELDDIPVSARVSGQYRLSQLYKLGEYEGQSGEYVKRKMQGFLRLPMTGYLVADQVGTMQIRWALWRRVIGADNSNISQLDAVYLLGQSYAMLWRRIPFGTLIKEGVIAETQEGYKVNDRRMQEFVGNSLFDWQVGEEGVTVAVVNETNVEGLGSDVAKFLTNVGMDVVSVRSGVKMEREQTVLRYQKKRTEVQATDLVLHQIFGESSPSEYEQDLSEYRSEIVILVGVDMLKMF